MEEKAQNPLISVVIPVFNGEKYLGEAIESIRQQGYVPLEVIIVDDGSTDGTARLVKHLGTDIQYIYQDNKGTAAARNTGLRAVKGDIIAFLDADDLWPDDKFALQIPRLKDDPELDIVLGRIQYVCLPGAEEPKHRFEEPDYTLTNVHLGSGLFRKTIFDEVGYFDEEMRFNEDMDWFFRALEQDVSMVIIKEVTLIYRLHQDNLTRGRGNKHQGLFKTLKKSLDRRRSRDGDQVQPLKRWSDFDEVKIESRK
jgi:glycosyltransferase involved in cell wall biosynthesis